MNWHLPFGVLVLVRVRLNGILFDEEFDALVEGCCDRWWLFPQQDFHGVVAGQTHDVIGTAGVSATLTVRTVDHAVCSEGMSEKFYS